MAVTMKDLAKMAGVSRPVVSAVLNSSTTSRVSPETREKILKLVTEMNYVPNLAARQLHGASSRIIGLLSVPTSLGLIAVLQAELITAVQELGFKVLVSHLSDDNNIQTVMNEFQARGVNGIIALNMKDKIIQKQNSFIPIVYCSDSNFCGFDVGSDRETGGYIAARHLLEHGRKKLLMLALDSDNFTKMKFYGVCNAIQEFDIESGKQNFLFSENGNTENILAEIRKRHVDALFCANDFIAAETLKLLLKQGIKVPDDVAVVGYDGYSFCKYTPVSLATVIQPIRQQVKTSIDILLDRINSMTDDKDFRNIKIPPFFYPAESCGCKESPQKHISGNSFILLQNPETYEEEK